MQWELLLRAGFAEVTEIDVTREFLQTERRWLRARGRHSDALRESEGSSEFEQEQTQIQGRIDVVEAGLVRRALFVAQRP